MSYCRFSSDNWRSDVYAYADVDGGYTIHVAANRIVGEVPELDWSTTESLLATHGPHQAFLDQAKREPIGLPHDGATFCEPWPWDCLARLMDLRDMGYRVPTEALDELVAEIDEIDDDGAQPG